MLGSYSKIAGLEKTARIWSRNLAIGESSVAMMPKWSERFEGTPFMKRAQEIERSEVVDGVAAAKQEVERAKRRVDDAMFEEKIASLEKRLADWKFTQEGSEKRAFVEKLAECRYQSFREWSDHFKGSPMFKEAMVLESEDAQREVERRKRSAEEAEHWRKMDHFSVDRAQLEADLAGWRLEQMGMSKTASAQLGAVQVVTGVDMNPILLAAFNDEMEKIALSRELALRAARAAEHSRSKLDIFDQPGQWGRRYMQMGTFGDYAKGGRANIGYSVRHLGTTPTGAQRASAQQTRAAEVLAGIKKPKPIKTRVIQRSFGRSADGSVTYK